MQADVLAVTEGTNANGSSASTSGPSGTTSIDPEDTEEAFRATGTQGSIGQAASPSSSSQGNSENDPAAASVIQDGATNGTTSATDSSDSQADAANGTTSATDSSDPQADSANGTSPATDSSDSSAEMVNPPAASGSAGMVNPSGTVAPAEMVVGSTTTAINTSALNASIAFFGAATIDPSSSGCSSCIGSATHATNYSMQMTSYAAFTGNCSAEIPGLSPSGTSTSGGVNNVGGPTSALTPAASSSAGVTATAAGAEEAVETKASGAAPFAKIPSIPLIPHSHYFASSPFLANKAPPEPDISGVEHDTFASEQRGEPDAETVQEQDNHQVAKAEGITEEQEKQAETEPEHLSDATTSSDMQTEAPAIDDSVFTSQESAINSGDEPSPSGEDAAVITSAPSSGTPHSSEIVSEHQPPSDAEASDKNAEKSASPSSSIEEEVREKNVTKVGFSRMRKAMWKDMSSMGNVPHFGYSHTLNLTPLLPYLQAVNRPKALRSESPYQSADIPLDLARDPLPHRDGTKTNLLSFLVKGMTFALQEHPVMRARIMSKGEDRWLDIRRDAVIGIAVSDPNHGLLIPSLPPLAVSTPLSAITSHLSSIRRNPTHITAPPNIVISSIGALGESTGTNPVLPPNGGLAICVIGRALWEVVPRPYSDAQWGGVGIIECLMVPN
ncbi:MAG: hypothetical protein TREMPRED_004967 [Tremellales sp. Tagirdzhanova-0007]|nr:MAG: hypothetical protein TREMPRED_004967 [Tremellales sp. Tagirdzhanova-0007]